MLERFQLIMFRPPRLDPSRDQELESELDEEFAFHLEQRSSEYLSQGFDADDARRAALGRFGDIQRIKTQCLRIALEERIMLQKINIVLMLVVLLLVAGVSVQMYVTQKYNTLAIQALSTQMADQALAQAVAQRAPKQALVEGDIAKPGWYDIRADGLEVTLLHELLLEAGGLKEGQQINIRNQERGITRAFYLAHELMGEDPTKVIVHPGDEFHVFVVEETPRSIRPYPYPNRTLSSGAWQQVDEAGQHIEDGMTLTIIGVEDIRNLKGFPVSSLNIPNLDHVIQLEFTGHPSSAQNLQIRGSFNSVDDFQKGRWQLDEGGILVVNLSMVAGAQPEHERILFRLDEPASQHAAQNTEARILVQGDIESPGWFSISLTGRGTTVVDMIDIAGVRPEQWVHLITPKTTSNAALAWWRPAYAIGNWAQVVLRPTHELNVRDEANLDSTLRKKYVISSTLGSSWEQVNEQGFRVENGWSLTFNDEREYNIIYGELTHPSGTRLAVHCKNNRVRTRPLNRDQSAGEPILLFNTSKEWDYERGLLSLNLERPDDGLAGELLFRRLETPIE